MQLTDRSPKESPYRREPAREDLSFELDRWFGRLLRILGTMLGIGLWLLAAGAVFLRLTN